MAAERSTGLDQLLHALVAAEDSGATDTLLQACERLRLSCTQVARSPQMVMDILQGSGTKPLIMFADIRWMDRIRAMAGGHVLPRTILITSQSSGRELLRQLLEGAEECIERPFDVDEAVDCMERVLHGPSILDQVAAAQVGRLGLKEMQHRVRQAMFTHALERTDGNRHAAARLLEVNRRAVQLAAKELDDARMSPPAMKSVRISRALRPPPVSGLRLVGDTSALVHERVTLYAPGTVLWRELPRRTPESVASVFENQPVRR